MHTILIDAMLGYKLISYSGLSKMEEIFVKKLVALAGDNPCGIRPIGTVQTEVVLGVGVILITPNH